MTTAPDAIRELLRAVPADALPELRREDTLAWWGGLGFHIGRGYDHVGHEIDQLLAAEAARRLENSNPVTEVSR